MARTAERTLTVVLDPHDDIDVLTRLRRLHARPLGQVVCEPAPTGGVARSVLTALGKNPDLGPRRDALWRLVDVHLRGEQTHDLIVLRAHTLTYAPLRRLADLTDAAHVHLWLVIHRERPPAAVAQLLEGVAHDTASLNELLQHSPELPDEDADDEPAFAAAQAFPYLAPICEGDDRGRPRSALTRSLTHDQRRLVHGVWDHAHARAARWLDAHPDASYQQCADAVYQLARRGDSASEIYVRIRAALDAFTRAGVDTDVPAIDTALNYTLGEVRPCHFDATIARATALADQTPDPQLAALIVLAAIFRCPRLIRELNHNALAADGSHIRSAWGGLFAVPPELRRFLATHHHQITALADANGRPLPLLPGSAHGRMSRPGIRRALAELNAPASLWQDQPGMPLGEGANADGRALLHALTAWNLWLRRAQPTPD